MKQTTVMAILLAFVFFMGSCKKEDPALTNPVLPDYQLAIDAKYKALGWTEGADNGGKPIQTKAAKGWVQYYGAASRAIYYFNGTAFSALKNTMTKFDAIGQDNFAVITADEKTIATGGSYLEITKLADNTAGVIVNTPANGTNTIYGDIYKKYLLLNRWDGPLGYPTIDESDLTSKKGRYNGFTKGQIYYSTVAGAVAFWGKINTLYGKAGYDGSWLGLPIEGCDINKTESNQTMNLQYGSIRLNGACGNFYTLANVQVWADGSKNTTGFIVCL